MTRTAYIQVRESPVLSFTADVTAGLVPLKVTVTNTSTGTTSVDWWRVQFSASPGLNDSSTRVETTDASTPVSFTYTNVGIYSVLMRANLAGGGNVQLTKTNYITVNGLKFNAVGSTTNLAPMAVTFTNQSIGMSSYLWDFGDGTTSTSTNPAHSYTTAGNYTVTLSGVYNGATISLARTNYIVANPAPVAGFYGINAVGQAPLNVAFVNTSANATNFVWSFGDGKSSTNANPANTYTNVGAYTVTLQAINLGVTNTLTRTNYIHANP
jgi:PKD repeat protein